MKNVTYEKFTNSPKHEFAAACFGVVSALSPTMREFGRKRMKGYEVSLLAFLADMDMPLGHVGAEYDERDMLTVVSYWVNPTFSKQGVGTGLLSKLVTIIGQEVPEVEACQANVHDAALSQFKNIGCTVIGPRAEPAETGCNTVVDVMPAIVLARQTAGVPA